MKIKRKIQSGKSLSQEALRELWYFRLRFVTLKPENSEEADFHYFSKTLRSGRVIRFFCEGQLVGMFLSRTRQVKTNQHSYCCYEPEYIFFEKACRRNHILPFTNFMEILRVILLNLHQEVYLLGYCYLASYYFTRNLLPRLQMYGQANLTEQMTHIFQEFQQSHDPDHEHPFLTSMPTYPRESCEQSTERFQGTAVYHDFVALNPNWHQGYGTLVCAQLDAKALWEIITVVKRRKKARPKTRERSF